MNEKEILNRYELDNIIVRLSFQIVEKLKDDTDYAIIGIKRRGAILADRIANAIFKFKNVKPKVGYLDITLYRDDLTEISDFPKLLGTDISFDVRGKTIVLIDDVIFTGRTVRAAIDAILDFGRPKKIIFVSLVDRGHREFPIQPDFVGKYVPTNIEEKINVKLMEIDNIDSVVIEKRG
ncbi:MAG: bifunctional pyr operon transcriptional regulator/uracil phosphoribosyltransferase PyrR [Calditerrivibrio sp.]|nr:bifunctional pyr operon transcriptional regulator/uracil phosphoribosyltransferase PyrR [Calditerrivibrio sp.]MCA1932080.1 bifunctional pyr operon transcriptional regulator/uracil phosphoribosyltransferase PyrR [Calditerrivibrio sp.]MCA1980213.1 bifunctional pyr operon transcriptional regulator/uracil phosphoribosyltransferase PyrR [Calditerrivibrio sp.]